MQSTFGERLRQLRGNATQAEAAEKIGINTSSYVMYENNNRRPGFEALVKIADHHGVSVDYLLGRTDVKSRDMDTQEIARKTGLSEQALEKLDMIARKGHMEVLNKILEEDGFIDCIECVSSGLKVFAIFTKDNFNHGDDYAEVRVDAHDAIVVIKGNKVYEYLLKIAVDKFEACVFALQLKSYLKIKNGDE